ncbi:MAG TPA: ABC transporter substrate-binding protein [Gaiellaceae bacterium]|nr:ABC transporter substrate-binding protein [Gaiellaceae bacterium]
MTGRRRGTWLLGAIALAAGVSMMVAAYGVAATRTHAAPKQAHAKFGTLRAVLDTIDFLDPQQAYTGQSWWAMWNVYETLLTYRHVDGPAGYQLVPGLAQSLPTISNNGRVYHFTLRQGLKYSNGKPVLASDFKWAIKRGFLATGQGVGFYTDIAGAEAYSKNPTPGGNIPGIIVNNKKRTITIKLVSPRGDFLTILALLFAAPVPGSTGPEIQNGSIPGTGPYYFASYDPNRSFVMVRNKYFKPNRFIPRGTPNRVEVSLIGDANTATQKVSSGQADYSNGAIPPDRIADAKSKGHLVLRQTANTYYFWMNIREAPFNKLKVRQAVNMAINRKSMQTLVWGGLGQSTQNVLPPTYPSYKKLNLYPYNLAKAKQLINQAGAKGAAVKVWTRQVSDAVTAATYYQSVLNAIGLNATLTILPRATYYTTIGNVNTHAQTGWARWLEDYPHPLDWFDVLLNGERITDQDNNNYAWYTNKKTNKEIDQLKKAPVLTPSVNKRWAAVEKQIMQQAPWAPWSNRVFPEYFTKQIGCIHIQRLYGIDLARLCRK